MRQTIYRIGLLLLIWSCSSNDKPVKPQTEIVLGSEDRLDKEFQLDISNDNLDFEKTKTLTGEWTASNGELKFLNTTLEAGDKVVFKDTISKTMSGWGTLIYNRAAKFYFTESASHTYDYYIDRDGLLNLVQLDYRNDDLSFKEQPEPIYVQVKINKLGDNQIELIVKDQKVKLKK